MNEVQRRVRAEFEKILERDHAVSKKEDKELLKGLWANFDEEDISYAASNLKAGVQDLVLDAVKSQLYLYYMGFKRGRGSLGSAEIKTQGERVGSGYLKGLEDELLNEGKAPDSKLKATTRARVGALSEYLSRIVAADRAVVRFRARVLGDPAKTLSPEEADKLIHSLAAEQQAGPPRDAETLWWSGNDKATQAEPIKVWPGSELWYLRNISSRLARRYPWTEDQACYFILTGQTIKAATISGRVSESSTGVAAHRYHRDTITLEIAAWVPSEYVRQAYHNVQHDLLGENNRQPELRNVEVFRFVVTHSKLQVVNREEGLAKLTISKWKELRELWNKKYQEGHEWHYHKKKDHRFSRDFYRGQEAVIGTRDGLPGVP
ncbi:MAG: hypothetical protein CYG60_24045, partial [Actinobacteria bacterium]